MKVKTTIAEIKRINFSSHVAIRNTKNYENVIKYFDFNKAVKSVLYNQN
jgi:hypothetical protein